MVERLVHDFRIQPKKGDKNGSKCWVFVCQLEGEGGEDEAEVAAVLEIA